METFREAVEDVLNTKHKNWGALKKAFKRLRLKYLPSQEASVKLSGRIEPHSLPILLASAALVSLPLIQVVRYYMAYMDGYVTALYQTPTAANYAGEMGKTFYLIAIVVVFTAVVACVTAFYVGKAVHCRSTFLIAVATLVPSVLLATYLEKFHTRAMPLALDSVLGGQALQGDSYTEFVHWVGFILFFSGLVSASFMRFTYASEVYDEDQRAFLKALRYGPYDARLAEEVRMLFEVDDFRKAVESLAHPSSRVKKSVPNRIWITLRRMGHEGNGYLSCDIELQALTRLGKRETERWQYYWRQLKSQDVGAIHSAFVDFDQSPGRI